MRAQNSRLAVLAAIAGNVLIAITKFGAGMVTGSSAMISEGIHSLVDTGNGGLLLYGLHRAQRPADERFPFGYGKEIYFWSFVVAIMIFAVGAGVAMYEGLMHILDPSPAEHVAVNFVVLGISAACEAMSWTVALREFRRGKGRYTYLQAVHRGKDPSVFMVLFEDTAALAGLLVATIGLGLAVVTGNPVWDGVASVLIGVILAMTAIWLAVETKGLLIGEAASPAVTESVRQIVTAHPAVVRLNECLSLHMGPDFILLTASIEFRDGLATGEIERATAALDRAIKAADPRIRRVFIEAASCGQPASKTAAA
jgi:cation diffusion facilitator family transporter